jgi:hypothetical protein
VVGGYDSRIAEASQQCELSMDFTMRQLDGEFSTVPVENGSSCGAFYIFQDSGTGFFSAGANAIGIATNGVERVEFGTTEVVFNDGGANYDFRIEGDTNANLFFVDASAEAVGIGTTATAQGVGGSITFHGIYEAAPITAFGGIEAKEQRNQL